MYGQGISSEGCIIDMAVDNNIMIKSGSWFSYKGNKIGQGKDNTRIYLIEHPDVKAEIEELIRDSYRPADDDDIPASDDKADAEELDDDFDADDILGIDE